MTLKGKVAIITGSASGIGLAITKKFAEQGANLILVDYNQEKLIMVPAKLGLSTAQCQTYCADVSQKEAMMQAVQLAIDTFGKLDILVNNAGILQPISGVDVVSETVAHQLMEVNFFGVLFGMQAAIPVMRKQGQGVIINMASLSAYKPTKNYSVYGASKAAVANLTLTAAHELAGEGIRILSVSPGVSDTGLNPPEVKKKLAQNVPLGRIAQPSDIANMVAFLASDEASYLTGENYSVTGGQRV
jgi:NAD(P)-dependent dehydrogenase (short-subunit alcohol dehydrogenase family)